MLQLVSDFFGISKTIVISLKSVECRKKYEKVFGRKLKDKKANPIIRAIIFNQSFLTYFISNLFEKMMSLDIVSYYFLTKNSNFKFIFLRTLKRTKKKSKVENVA